MARADVATDAGRTRDVAETEIGGHADMTDRTNPSGTDFADAHATCCHASAAGLAECAPPTAPK